MPADSGLDLTPAEVAKAFSEPTIATKFPPVLTIELAADLLQVPVETIRGWRSRRLLDSCSKRTGKRVRFLRDRLLMWFSPTKATANSTYWSTSFDLEGDDHVDR